MHHEDGTVAWRVAPYFGFIKFNYILHAAKSDQGLQDRADDVLGVQFRTPWM